MGIIIWYQLTFHGSGAAALPPLRVSNDVASGEYILDADIHLTMAAGPTADTLDLTLTNLPADVADGLKSAQTQGLAAKDPLQVKVALGYFEDSLARASADPVMLGAVTRVTSTVDSDGMLVTRVRGQELGGYKLRTSAFTFDAPGQSDADQFVRQIASASGVQVAPGSVLGTTVNNFSVRNDSALGALGQLARLTGSALVVRDGQIFIGPSVGAGPGATFDPDTNIVSLDHSQDGDEDDAPPALQTDDKLQTSARTRFDLTVLGDPSLRVGQSAVLKTPDTPAATLRINHLVHNFSTRSGYTCGVTLLAADPGKPARGASGADELVERLHGFTKALQDGHPVVDVGEVSAYQPGKDAKHLATLFYGQTPPAGTLAPSVETPVDRGSQLHEKPVASPFAFSNCGLVVPVYPGMRALLTHSGGSVNDAAVAGFLWPDDPASNPPQNEPGDYWLCLPTELGASDGRPTGKGVNDLTDASGLRVIQAKGLQIFVGSKKLPDVGSRPALPDAQTIVIEHESGTTVSVGSDGAVTITTKSKDISLSNDTSPSNASTVTVGGDGAVTITTKSKDISLSNGSVALKLSGSAVNITTGS